MKVLYVGSFRFPGQDAAAARVLNNAKVMRELGHQVTFISWGGMPNEDDYCDGRYVYQGFEYINTRELRNNSHSLIDIFLLYFCRGYKTIRIIRDIKMRGDVDVVVAYNTSLFFTWLCNKYCISNKIFFISDLTEWYSASDFIGGFFLPAFWMNELSMRYVQKKVRNKIVISSYLKNYYLNGNIILIPPLIDVEENKIFFEKQVIADVITKSNSAVIFIFAGNPANKDMLKEFVTAIHSVFEEGKDVRLVVLGVSDREKGLYLGNTHAPEVIFLGKVPQNMVPFYYHQADFSFVIRKRNKKNMAGFPTKMAESLAAGCPVLINNTSDLFQFVNDGYDAVLLKNYKMSSIIDGIKRICNLSRSEINVMKENARATGERKFSYQSYISIFEIFFNSLS